MTDIYFRNPEAYIQEVQEADVRLLSWDIGDLKKRNIDPLKFASMYLGHARPWKLIVVAIEGAAEYNETTQNLDKPAAVYPTWRWHYGFEKLRDYCANPVGEDMKLCFDKWTEGRFRPVWGQPHKVVIYDAPNLRTHEGMQFFRQLRAVKHQFPNVDFIIHNTASFRLMFGADFEGAMFDPRMTAKLGSVVLPNGRAIGQEEFGDFKMWIRVLGFTARDLKSTTFDRVMYNIESVRWAAANYRDNINFRISVQHDIDIDSPDGEYRLAKETQTWITNVQAKASMKPGDGVICDACSLVSVCKYYREGMVCGVPKSSSAELAKMFGTRDAGVIIDGLVELTQIQAERVGMDLDEERATGERLPQTDKRIKDLFDAGVKVAKLIDPNLNGKGTTVNVGVVGGAAIVAQQTPQELMARAVQTLESHGIRREEITGDMIKGLLEGVANRTAIEDTIDAELVEE